MADAAGYAQERFHLLFFISLEESSFLQNINFIFYFQCISIDSFRECHKKQKLYLKKNFNFIIIFLRTTRKQAVSRLQSNCCREIGTEAGKWLARLPSRMPIPPSEAVLRHPAKKFPNTWVFLSFACSHCLFQPKRARVQGQNRFIMEYIMSKVLMVYGSTTGNTEALAEILGRLIQEAGHETTLLNAADASAPGLCDGWDMILFGCSAWGDDEIILQDDFDALFQQFDLINAKGHKVACFATGDSNFTYFCGAVDVIEAALERLGADVVVEGLKIDGQAQSDQPEIQEWTKAVIETL